MKIFSALKFPYDRVCHIMSALFDSQKTQNNLIIYCNIVRLGKKLFWQGREQKKSKQTAAKSGLVVQTLFSSSLIWIDAVHSRSRQTISIDNKDNILAKAWFHFGSRVENLRWASNSNLQQTKALLFAFKPAFFSDCEVMGEKVSCSPYQNLLLPGHNSFWDMGWLSLGQQVGSRLSRNRHFRLGHHGWSSCCIYIQTSEEKIRSYFIKHYSLWN